MGEPAVQRYPYGAIRPVKNLGWLLRHASQVQRLCLVQSLDGDGAILEAEVTLPGTTEIDVYRCRFASYTVAQRWLNRRVLAHVNRVVLSDYSGMLVRVVGYQAPAYPPTPHRIGSGPAFASEAVAGSTNQERTTA